MSLLIKAKLIEWGPIRRETFIMRMTPLMPPGYAWVRWVRDSPTERKRRRELEDEGEEYEMPTPQGDDIRKAQQALVKWNLRQFKRQGFLVEKDDGTIDLTSEEIAKVAKP